MTDNTQQARAASIPDAAIEAAAKVLRARFNGQREDKPWSSGDQMRIYVGDARAALEAAAPYVRASALEDAADYVDGVKVSGTAAVSSVWLRKRAAEERGASRG